MPYCLLFDARYDKWKSAKTTPSLLNQPLMSQFTENQNVYAATNWRQKELKNAIVSNLVIGGNLPLSIVETTWFSNFMKIVDPKFAMPSRKQVANTLSQAYKAKRQALRDKLSSTDNVSLTLDMWSDRRMRSFMAVTVHILSPDMQPESWLLDMSSFTGSHTGDKIGNHCVLLVDEFNIHPKISYIVTDNAANMLKAFRFMSELFPDDDNDRDDEASTDMTDEEETELDESHDAEGDYLVHPRADDVIVEIDGEEPLSEEIVDNILSNFDGIRNLRLSCGIHTLQLVVRDGFQCAKFMSPILSKASRLSNMVHTSGLFAEKFFAVFKNTIPSTNLTRWNSTYIQLEALSKLDPSKLHALLTEHKLEVCILTKREMNILLEVVYTLEPAYNATMIMQADDALVSLLAPTVVSLHKKWQTMVHNSVHCSSLAKALLESLETRFSGLLNNLKPLPSLPVPTTDNSSSKAYGSGPFGDFIYPVAAAIDPEIRLAWLDEWQDDWDLTVKPRVTGMS